LIEIQRILEIDTRNQLTRVVVGRRARASNLDEYDACANTHLHNSSGSAIELASRNAGNKVEYATDFYILKPMDAARGNKSLFTKLLNV
jgi:hypothetical protein